MTTLSLHHGRAWGWIPGRHPSRHTLPVIASTWLFIGWLILGSTPRAQAQIGGKTAADGTFILDDVEDLNLTAGGVQRDWIADFVPSVATPLQAIGLSTAGLTLATNQTPTGALKFATAPSYGYIDYGFGVPLPAVAGASTATNPGNIDAFTRLTFDACFDKVLAGQKFSVMLFGYPQGTDGKYPALIWHFAPAAGTTFQPVSLNLHAPDAVQQAAGTNVTVDQLLGQAQFLYFFCYAGGSLQPTDKLDLYIDDIKLEPGTVPVELSAFSVE